MKFFDRKGLLYFSLFCLFSCDDFDGDVLRKYLPQEVADAPVIYNERDILFCAVSIYRAPKNQIRSSKPLSKPNRSSSDWMVLPIKGKMKSGSFGEQALSDGDDCMEKEAQRILGFDTLTERYWNAGRGYFIEVNHDLILIHDTDLNLFIVSARAR